MIHDLDESVRVLLERDALAGTDVEVVFDAPTREWSSRRTAPTLDVYLYDIREDVRWRSNGTVEIRDDDGFVTGRESPPRFFRFAYLITAWTQRPEDEHRLLSSVLLCFLKDDKLPADVLAGSLAGHPVPIRLTIALPPPQDRSISDVWTALGGELKPSLDLVLLAAIEAGTVRRVGPPVLETPLVRVSGGKAVTGGSPRRRPGRRSPTDGSPTDRSPTDRSPTDGAIDAVPGAAETVTGGRGEHKGRTLAIEAIDGRQPPA